MHMRNTVIMAVLFVLVGGFVYLYEIRGREAREVAEEEASRLVHFEPEAVTRLTVSSGDQSVTAVREEGSWRIVEPRELPADGEALDALVDDVHAASQERLINESPEDLAAFGLASPEARVVLTLADGSEVSLAVGKDTPVGMNLYASNDEGAVYSAPRALRSQVNKSLYDLRDRSVLEFDETAVQQLEIDTGALSARLRREPGTTGEAGESGDWMLEAPVSARADTDTVEGLLSELAAGEAEAFVTHARPTAEELQRTGLESAETRITVRTGDDASRTLLIGAESDEPEGRYAMREGGESIFVVDPSLLEEIPSELADLRNKQLLAVGREAIRALEIAATDDAGQALRIERDGADFRLTSPRQLEADASEVSRLLGALEDLRAEGFGDAPPADTELRVRLQTVSPEEGGEPGSIEIRIGTDARTLAAEEGDEDPVVTRPVTVSGDDTVYLVAEADLDDLRVDAFDLRAKTLVEFTQPDLTRIELTTADGTTRVLERSGEEWSLQDGGAVDADVVDDLLWELNYLRMEGVATEWASEDRPDLTAYGLQEPRFRVVARTADGVVADVSVGAEPTPAEEGDPGRVYVLVDDRPGVYEVGATLADVLATTVEALGS